MAEGEAAEAALYALCELCEAQGRRGGQGSLAPQLLRRILSVPVPKLREASEGLKGVRELLTYYTAERGRQTHRGYAVMRGIVKWKK